ncbi:MAG: hypothetical protein AAF567_07205 [Actinomycetota bacterium]
MSLVARHLEEAGIPTVVIGSAQDIVETCGVSRMIFVDYPLGNPCGKPGDTAEQRFVAEEALRLLTTAVGPRMTYRLPLEWGSDDWRPNYMHVGADNLADLQAAGEARRASQAAAREAGVTWQGDDEG